VVTRRDVDGTLLAAVTVPVDLLAREAVSVSLPPSVSVPGDPTRELIVAGTDTDRALWHFVEDIAAMLPEPRLSARVEPTASGYRLTVRAETFVRDLTVLADRVAGDAHVDEALVTLLAGETATFNVRTAATVEPEIFLDPLVLRSANQLVAAQNRARILSTGGGDP
jgi:beta-mannosidase